MSSDSTNPPLCTECGLCCSGVIFEDVELRDVHEASSMEVLGLDVEEEEGRYLLIQPCRALHRRRCRIYTHRPECCRQFECRLLREYQQNKVSREEALALIREVRRRQRSGEQDALQALVASRFLDWNEEIPGNDPSHA